MANWLSGLVNDVSQGRWCCVFFFFFDLDVEVPVSNDLCLLWVGAEVWIGDRVVSLRSAVISLCECRIAWNVTFAKQLLPKFVMPLSGMSRVYSSSVPAPPGSLMCCVSVASFGML